MTDGYPLFLYEYNAAGRYGKPTKINTAGQLEEEMKTTIRWALEEKREVRITDTGDMLVFHAKGGRIVLPTQGQIAGTEEV